MDYLYTQLSNMHLADSWKTNQGCISLHQVTILSSKCSFLMEDSDP